MVSSSDNWPIPTDQTATPHVRMLAMIYPYERDYFPGHRTEVPLEGSPVKAKGEDIIPIRKSQLRPPRFNLTSRSRILAIKKYR